MGDGNGHTVTVTFTVSVIDLADETPVISAPADMSTINFNENDRVTGTLAISVTGTDADASDTMVFALVTNPSTLFTLTTVTTVNIGASATLGLSGGNTLDFETLPNTYDIEVSCVSCIPHQSYCAITCFHIMQSLFV